jgi:hypothetical protein
MYIILILFSNYQSLLIYIFRFCIFNPFIQKYLISFLLFLFFYSLKNFLLVQIDWIFESFIRYLLNFRNLLFLKINNQKLKLMSKCKYFYLSCLVLKYVLRL